jgi:acyl phosphate:glycerol-3-phosphate acyltransferase
MAWITIVFSYLLGTLPTAYIAGKLLRGKDIRRMGDTNSGAANAYRELGARVGIVVGLIDGAKGALAVLIARALDLSETWVLFAGLAVVAGHNWPFFLGFRGGKGVSTTLGVFMIVLTLPSLIMAVPCLLTLIFTRSVDKAMAVFFIAVIGLCWMMHLSVLLIGFSVLLPLIIGITHFFRARMPVRL